jgi:hypothetical protein
MEERYTIRLTFEQINTLLHSGIYGGLQRIEECIRKLDEENPGCNFRPHFQNSINALESANGDIRTQLWEQGNENLGWSPEDLKRHKLFNEKG